MENSWATWNKHYIDHPDFKTKEKEILGFIFDKNKHCKNNVIISSAEKFLFLKMNFLYKKAAKSKAKGEEYYKEACEIRNILWEYNQPLIYRELQIRRKYHSNIDRDIFVSNCNLILYKCIIKFNVKYNFKFSTYVCNALSYTSMVHYYRTMNDKLKLSRIDLGLVNSNLKYKQNFDLIDIAMIIDDYCKETDKTVAKVIKHYFYDGFTLRDIAKIIGYSPEWTRQILLSSYSELVMRLS